MATVNTIHFLQHGEPGGPDPFPSAIMPDGRIWTTKNLNVDMGDGLSRCYNDDPAMCAIYGRLYTFAGAQAAAPTGWHVATLEEWQGLRATVGGVFPLLATHGWPRNRGTDDFGFTVLPGGQMYSDGYSSSIGDSARFWTSTTDQYFEMDGWFVMLEDYDSGIFGSGTYRKTDLLCSVRLVKDEE